MRVGVNTWQSFQAGDVIVEPSSGPEPVVVEREVAGPRFGTAQVEGETLRGFLTSEGRFAHPAADGGYSVTANYREFVEEPDWKAAVDAYARVVEDVRRTVSSTPDGALRTELERLIDGGAMRSPAISHRRLVDVIRQAIRGRRPDAALAEMAASAAEILLKADLGIEKKP